MRKLIATALVVISLVAGCGSDDDAAVETEDTTSRDEAAFPVTIDAANGEVTIEREPTRIVSLSPTATEMLFAIGAGDQVVAADANSNYPANVPKRSLDAYEPNVEAIVGERPDLVVLSNDPGAVVDGLAAARVPALLLPAGETFDDTYEQLEQLGVATGHMADAAEVVADIRRAIRDVAADVRDAGKGLTYYHELDDSLYTVTSKTFIGQVYAQLGLENIADEADSTGSGYPQLSAEYIVQRDPDLVFLADTKCCQQSRATLAARPGFAELTAVESDQVVELDDDVASRWGPRVVDFLRVVAKSVERVQAAKAAS